MHRVPTRRSHIHQLDACIMHELAVVEVEREHATFEDLEHDACLAEKVLRCGLQAVPVRNNQRAAPGLTRISRARKRALHSPVAGGVILVPLRKHRGIDVAGDVRIGDVW